MKNLPDFSGANWQKSSYSISGECVEVATVDHFVGVRDSKDREGPVLMFNTGEWNAFLAGTRNGEFDCVPEGAATPG